MARTKAAQKPSKGEVISFDIDTDKIRARELEVAKESDDEATARWDKA